MQTKILLENQKPASSFFERVESARGHGFTAAFWIVLFSLFFTVVTVYADGPVLPGKAPGGAATTTATAPLATGTAPAAPAQSPFGMMTPILIMFAVVYFMMIRPQQKKVKDQQKMISELSDGDQVVTSSGILGTITGIADKVVTLEIADKVRIKILKSQIAQVVKGPIKDLA